MSARSPPGIDASVARALFPPQRTPRVRLPLTTQRALAAAVQARDWSEVLRLKEMFEFLLERQMNEEEAVQQRKIQKVDASAK